MLSFTVHKSHFRYGHFINALLAFVIVAAVVYYFVVLPFSRLVDRFKTKPTDAPTRNCPYCLSSVPAAASRCAFCTSELESAPA